MQRTLFVAALVAALCSCGGETRRAGGGGGVGGEVGGEAVCVAGDTQRCLCPPDRRGVQVCKDTRDGWQMCNCGEEPTDGDSDGVYDGDDNCRKQPNPNQRDSDGDGFGDSCDNCPTADNVRQVDTDGDRIGDECDPCPSDPSPTCVPSVTISVHSAVIAPGKRDGTQWDGPGTRVAQEVATAITRALATANPYAAVLSVMMGPTVAALEKPDVAGIARLIERGQEDETSVALPKRQDNFVPAWGNPGGWSGVRLERGLTVRVSLWDEDLFADDTIGVADIGFDELAAAAESGEQYPVNVSSQTHGQALFVGVSVLLE